MTVSTCPTELANAPPAAVWALLADPLQYPAWVDAHLASITPRGPATPGQRLSFRAPKWGRWFRVDIVVDGVDAVNHSLELTTRFPFGLVIRNRIAVAAVNADTSRVQFG